LECGVAGADRPILDEDALAGGLLEPFVEDPVHPARLAGASRVRIDALRPDHAGQRERQYDEAEPAADCCLPVCGAPATHAGRDAVVLPCWGHDRPSFLVLRRARVHASTLGSRAPSSLVPKARSCSDETTIQAPT